MATTPVQHPCLVAGLHSVIQCRTLLGPCPLWCTNLAQNYLLTGGMLTPAVQRPRQLAGTFPQLPGRGRRLRCVLHNCHFWLEPRRTGAALLHLHPLAPT